MGIDQARHYNATAGISFNNATGQVTNCLIVDNGWGGINCKNGSDPQINHCLIMDNEYGIECNSKSRAVVKNSIIWNNEKAVYLNGKGTVRLFNTLYQEMEFPEDVLDGGGNLLGENPLLDSDFTPMEGSPCYKAGNDGKNMGVLF